jgi:ubiquilin
MAKTFLCHVKKPDGSILAIDVDPDMTVAELQGILTERTDLTKEDMRLIFGGRVIKGNSTLDSCGLSLSNSTVHLITSKQKDSAQEADPFGTTPPFLLQLQHHLLANPEVMQQMMNSPAMQTLLNNKDLLRSVVMMNPQMRTLVDRTPELREMLHDQAFMSTALEAFRNPTLMREHLRSSEGALRSMENVPGGFETIKALFKKVEGPYAEAVEHAALKIEEDGPPSEFPELSFDPNAMAAMFQDPNMVQLMASLFTAKEKQATQGIEVSMGTCFTDPAFVAKLFQPATMQVVAQMQNAMQQLSHKSEEDEFNPVANPYYPGANFSNSFGNFLLAQQENPELQYRSQLQALKSMGFVDLDANVQALIATDGNVTRAIEQLLEQQEP